MGMFKIGKKNTEYSESMSYYESMPYYDMIDDTVQSWDTDQISYINEGNEVALNMEHTLQPQRPLFSSNFLVEFEEQWEMLNHMVGSVTEFSINNLQEGIINISLFLMEDFNPQIFNGLMESRGVDISLGMLNEMGLVTHRFNLNTHLTEINYHGMSYNRHEPQRVDLSFRIIEYMLTN